MDLLRSDDWDVVLIGCEVEGTTLSSQAAYFAPGQRAALLKLSAEESSTQQSAYLVNIPDFLQKTNQIFVSLENLEWQLGTH